MKKNVLGLLAKYPAPGIVKTRLARDIGVKDAAEVYRSIAEKVFKQTVPIGGSYERVVFYTPLSSRGDFEKWLPGERLLAQNGTELGDIMANALRDILSDGAAKAVITGVDIPDLGEGIVRDAFARLEDADIVIGPAIDGGYYLIGMKARHDEIFRGISWSTARVFHETIRIIDALGLSYSTVRTLSDVDRVADIINWGKLRS
ncbi:MAG: TIGR04282 family arsenosugar biosynthesis glycosyltransferase [Acidobacteriota bacterium]